MAKKKKKSKFFSVLLAIMLIVGGGAVVLNGLGVDLSGIVGGIGEIGGPHSHKYTATEIHEKAKNSVGEIITYDKRGNELALGSGFVYSADGKIITNYHVIEDAYSAKITLNGVTYNFDSVLAYDKTIDLAVLKITASGLPVLSICTESHAVGSSVYAFGSSKGLTATFSQGIITYDDREMDGVHYVQHDAAISSGNSGGPLINEYGEIIGINVMTIKDSQNLNFAVLAKELSNLTYDTSLTFAQFYEKECDVFTKLKNYVISKGTYDYSDKEYEYIFKSTYSSDYTTKYIAYLDYDVADDELQLSLYMSSGYLLMLHIDEIDGVYSYGWIDDYNNYLYGNVYASIYTISSTLSYTYYDMSYSLVSSAKNLASTMLKLLLTYFDGYFTSMGITVEDLGFISF